MVLPNSLLWKNRRNIWDKYFDLQTEMKAPNHQSHVLPKNSNGHIKILSLGTGSSGKATIYC